MATHDAGALPPMMPPRPNVAETIDWDTPVGRAHAHNLVAILAAHDRARA